jgi:nucleotide-binding universal stress UspA family protein
VPGTIVVGYDGSEGADAALEQALVLAQRFGDRLIVCFGVAPPGNVGEEYKAHRDALEEIARDATATALDRARTAGVEAEVALVRERPAPALADLAAEHDARFIVVGSYGEGPLRGALLGATPHKLLQLAHTPLVVVPAREQGA